MIYIYIYIISLKITNISFRHLLWKNLWKFLSFIRQLRIKSINNSYFTNPHFLHYYYWLSPFPKIMKIIGKTFFNLIDKKISVKFSACIKKYDSRRIYPINTNNVFINFYIVILYNTLLTSSYTSQQIQSYTLPHLTVNLVVSFYPLFIIAPKAEAI